MTDLATLAILIAAATFVMNIILAVRKGQWGLPDRLNQLETRIMAAVKDHRDHTDTVLDQSRQELDAAIEKSSREFGETVHAMQNKIQQLELWMRDTFVRRDSFMVVIKETRDTIEKQGAVLERGLEKLNNKLDSVIERQMTRMALNKPDHAD